MVKPFRFVRFFFPKKVFKKRLISSPKNIHEDRHLIDLQHSLNPSRIQKKGANWSLSRLVISEFQKDFPQLLSIQPLTWFPRFDTSDLMPPRFKILIWKKGEEMSGIQVVCSQKTYIILRSSGSQNKANWIGE